MAEDPPRRRSPLIRPNIVSAIALVAALAAFAALASGCRDGTSAPSRSAEDSGTAASAPAIETLQLKVGETYRAGSIAVRVVSAGPANLPPQMTPVPEGKTRVAVRTTFANESDAALPLNATPYSAYTTSLVVDGVSYPGALVSGVVAETRDGTIPAGRELDLRFVFEVPVGSTAATLVWPPAPPARGFPQLEVGLADVSANP